MTGFLPVVILSDPDRGSLWIKYDDDECMLLTLQMYSPGANALNVLMVVITV